MEKILTLTQEQFDKFKSNKGRKKLISEVIGVKGKYNIGDTTVQINNSQPLEIYKNTWNGKDSYYIVAQRLDEDLAFAYSIYST